MVPNRLIWFQNGDIDVWFLLLDQSPRRLRGQSGVQGSNHDIDGRSPDWGKAEQ